jgi:hypothetical protein
VLGGLGAQCLPYPAKGVAIGDLVKWFQEELKSLLEVFTQLNQNFVALALVGVLRMLDDSGCKHLAMLNLVATSSEASVLEEIPAEVQKIVR